MIKRIVLLLAFVLVAGGMAWGQAGPPGPTPPPSGSDPGWAAPETPPPPLPPSLDPPGRPSAGAGLMGTAGPISAVPGRVSTDARFSAGRFTSSADTFINPRFHSPDIGTFFFLNGLFGTDGQGAGRSRFAGVDGFNHFEAGFGQSLGFMYLGVYYRGRILNGGGGSMDEHVPGYLPGVSESTLDWENNLALLVGILGMGIRLDFIVNTTTDREGVSHPNDEGWSMRRRDAGPALALSWGMQLGPLLPWARVGYRFASTYMFEYVRATYRVEESFSAGSALEFAGGTRFVLSPTSAVGAEIRFRNVFPEVESYAFSGTIKQDFRTRRYGQVGWGFTAYYQQRIDAAGVSIGFRPFLDAGLTNRSNDWDGDTFAWTQPGDRWTTIAGGVDLGLRLRPNETFTFFAGVGLRLFDWTTWTETRGDDAHPALASSWNFSGIRWHNQDGVHPYGAGNLSLGMTFTPAEEVSLGLGLNGILNSGFFIRNTPTIDLTLSVRLNGGGRADPAPAPAPAPAAPAAVEAPVVEVFEGGEE